MNTFGYGWQQRKIGIWYAKLRWSRWKWLAEILRENKRLVVADMCMYYKMQWKKKRKLLTWAEGKYIYTLWTQAEIWANQNEIIMIHETVLYRIRLKRNGKSKID